jgi:uncharacterized protein YacL
MGTMHDFPLYLHEIVEFFRDGLREGFAHINAALGLIIGLVAAYMLHSWKKIWQMALGATVIHLVAEIMIPVLANQSRFELPPNLMEVSYWRTAIALYLGYLVVIAVFFFLKQNMLPKGGTAKAH